MPSYLNEQLTSPGLLAKEPIPTEDPGHKLWNDNPANPSSQCTSDVTSSSHATFVDTKLNLKENVPSPSAPTRKLRVAVVGSGLAGLTVAHLLSSLHSDNGHGHEGIEVELFEKAHKL
ncbi:hypothetical protein BGZ65_001276, partial [Modicella reniformis]